MCPRQTCQNRFWVLLFVQTLSLLWHLSLFAGYRSTRLIRITAVAHLQNSVKHLCSWVRGASDEGSVPNLLSHFGSGSQWMIWQTNKAVFLSQSLLIITACLISPPACLLHPAVFLLLCCVCHILTSPDFACLTESWTLTSFSYLFSSSNPADGNYWQVGIFLFFFIHSPVHTHVCLFAFLNGPSHSQ